MATPEQLLQALQTVVDPNTGKDFVSTKQLRNLSVEGGSVSFDVELGYPAKSQMPEFRKALVAAAKTVAGVSNVSINMSSKAIPITRQLVYGTTASSIRRRRVTCLGCRSPRR